MAGRRTGRGTTSTARPAVQPPTDQRALSLVRDPVPVGRDIPPPDLTRWSPTTYSELTWAQVDAIRKLAARGMTQQFVDLTRRMLQSDDHLASNYHSRIDPVAGAPHVVKARANVSPERDRIAKMAADDCAWALDRLPMEALKKHLLDATFTGYAAAEIVWEVVGGMVVPADVILHHPRRFQFAYDFSLYVYDPGVMPSHGSNTANGALGPPLARDKFIVHIPRTLPDYPTASGLFLSLLRPWWVKSWVVKFWLSGAELAGNPRLIGKYPQNADAATKTAFFNALNAVSADGAGTITNESSIEYLVGPSQVGTTWQDLCARMDASMSKIVLGSTLNTDVGSTGGNRALGESQDQNTTLPRLEGDGRSMWTSIERMLFEPFLRFNAARYGGVIPPIPCGESQVVRKKAEIDQLVIDTGSATIDEVRVSRGLEPWGAEKGGDRPALSAQPAPAWGARQQPPADVPAVSPLPPSGGADAGGPFPAARPSPWQRAASAALALSPPAPTTPTPGTATTTR